MFILLRLVINAVALLLAAWIVPGIHLAAAIVLIVAVTSRRGPAPVDAHA